MAFVLPVFFLKSLKKEMEMIEKAAGESLAGLAAMLFCLFSFSFQIAAAVFAFSHQAWRHVADCEWRTAGACLIVGSLCRVFYVLEYQKSDNDREKHGRNRMLIEAAPAVRTVKVSAGYTPPPNRLPALPAVTGTDRSRQIPLPAFLRFCRRLSDNRAENQTAFGGQKAGGVSENRHLPRV
ncbi:hypothetical protein [Neisseria musculi]|uniref:hypothetical protein n=1 Tax=Neisseria musculi TaxID=1815583 RepID=UPI001FEAE8FD|nr:hypothetical protein [Neisseria musculi]